MRLFTLILLLCNSTILPAQNEDNYFFSGYFTGEQSWFDDRFGLNIVNFTEGKIETTCNQVAESDFRNSSCSISDKDGNLLFYFNGKEVYHHQHDTMENGVLLTWPSGWGYNIPQGSVIVPFPDHPNQYILIYCEQGWVGTVASIGMHYAVVDMSKNNGLGKVIEPRNSVLYDTTYLGKITMTHHANGKDWWLCTGKDFSDTMHVFLLDRNGFSLVHKQPWGVNRGSDLGQAYFSPDGTKFISCGTWGSPTWYSFIDVYDFDRCNGELSNPRRMERIIPNGNVVSIAISPDSKKLYYYDIDSLFQYDLSSDSIFKTKRFIDAYDGFEDPFATGFFFGFPAPDGKLYLITTSGSQSLHVIHKPNKAGQSCDFEQHGIRMPCVYSRSLPTAANYRLGPLDGSPCDTLGLDNHPVADFWADVETPCGSGVFVAEMVNRSYFAPETWHWDFGDGSTSTDTSPVHTYFGEGIYDICLTVCNANSCDTLCRPLQLGTAAGSLHSAFTPKLTYWYDSLLYDFTGMDYDFPVTYTWDFGDGNTAEGKFQRHRFDSAGLWQVCLTVCAGAQTDIFCMDIITGDAYGAFIAGFDFRVLDSLGTVEFRDKSTALPAFWDWDFGDGNTSTERSPIHQYDTAGLYHVCLTSCNADTICDNYCLDVPIGGTSGQSVVVHEKVQLFSLFPNPVRDVQFVQAHPIFSFKKPLLYQLYDQAGRLVFSEKLPPNVRHWKVDLRAVPSGFYFYEIKDVEGRPWQEGKVLRI